MDIERVKQTLETATQEDIQFDTHFYKRSMMRPVNEGMVRRFILDTKRLEQVERGEQGKSRHKLWFKMSSKYSLVIIVEIKTPKGLKVISAWNTHRKWQNKLKR